MSRRWITTGCVVMLAGGLAIGSFAGIIIETDDDGIPTEFDDCVLVPNGPLLQTGSCNNQEDGDHDGYGNPCDHDTNNDGAAGFDDLSATLAAAKVVSTNPIYDFNCDGATGFDDVSVMLIAARSVEVPGPSGYACAGTIPCP